MELFWISQVAAVILWIVLVAFVWNNKWRGTADQARIYRGPTLSTALDLLQIIIPISSCIWIFLRYNLWFALVGGIAYWFLSNRIMWWRYKVVFRQYRALHVWDLDRKGELAKYSDAEIEKFVHRWLMQNAKKDYV